MMVLESLLNTVLGFIILIAIIGLIYAVLKKADEKYGTTKEEQEQREKEKYDAYEEYEANKLKQLFDSHRKSSNYNEEDDGLPF